MKNSCNYWFFLLFFAPALAVNGQNFALGVRGGLSIPNLSTASGEQNPLNSGYKSRVGPQYGLSLEDRISTTFSLQVLAEYSSQGGKKNGLQAFPTPAQVAEEFPAGQAPTYLYANFNSTAKLNYLMIPVLAKFGWNLGQSPFRFYVDAGPFVSFLLSAKQVTTGQSEFYTDPSGTQPLPGGAQSFNKTTDIKDQLHSSNLGAEANAGLIYNIGKSSVFVEGGGNYGFLNIQKGSANGKNNTGAACVVVGYSIWLGRKS
jgi:hypothetical protein